MDNSEGKWKEAGMTAIKVLGQNLAGGAAKNCQVRTVTVLTKIQTGYFMDNRGITTWANSLSGNMLTEYKTQYINIHVILNSVSLSLPLT